MRKNQDGSDSVLVLALFIKEAPMMLILHPVTTTKLLKRATRVREQVFTEEMKIAKSIEADELDCLDGPCDHFVVELDGKDVCAFRCKKLDAQCVQLQRFCVMKDCRKTGVGRWALSQMEAYYGNRGFEVITLDAKFHVHGFYEKCGYQVVSEPFMEAGVEHVVMEKRCIR